MSRIPVAREDLSIKNPLPWAVYDQDGKILMPEGAVLLNEEQLKALLANHPLHELCWDSADAAAAQDHPHGFGSDLDLELALGDAPEGELKFQDMRLRVGERLQLQPPPTVDRERHIVKLIGYLDHVSLLVTAPMVNGMRLQLEEGDEVVVRIFSSQKAFGFGCSVDKVCKIPFDYLHLSFPQRIQGTAIRQSPRVRTRIIASIAKPDAVDGNGRQSGIIANLSAGGALVKVRHPLFDNGQIVRLSFRANVHQVDAHVTVSAIIRSTFCEQEDVGADATLINHGIEFRDLPPNDSVILQSLIYQQMIEQPQSLT